MSDVKMVKGPHYLEQTVLGKATTLEEARASLDYIDKQILQAVKVRQEMSREVAVLKKETGATITDYTQEADKLKRLAKDCSEEGVDYALMKSLYLLLSSHSKRVQRSPDKYKTVSHKQKSNRKGN
jgi:chorismate mutase